MHSRMQARTHTHMHACTYTYMVDAVTLLTTATWRADSNHLQWVPDHTPLSYSCVGLHHDAPFPVACNALWLQDDSVSPQPDASGALQSRPVRLELRITTVNYKEDNVILTHVLVLYPHFLPLLFSFLPCLYHLLSASKQMIHSSWHIPCC